MKNRKPLKISTKLPTNYQHNQSFCKKSCTHNLIKQVRAPLRYTYRSKSGYMTIDCLLVLLLLLLTREANKRLSYERHTLKRTVSTVVVRSTPVKASHHPAAITHLLTDAHLSNETRKNRMITQANRSFGITLTWQHQQCWWAGHLYYSYYRCTSSAR